MKSSDIREQFLKFFESKGHTRVPSSPLVPGNDPTLMFTNSGMVQFKDVFLGTDKRPYVRATSVQACLRAGGKHNDLENVGYTARHHTFFEMLGNWSFGDYFKRESLKWGWELLTEVYKLPADKLWATVYHEDDEAYDIWTREIGLPPERVVRIGDNKGGRYMSDNFWMMADTGPCGPCSEVFYDHGPGIAGGPPGSPDADGDRYIEIWNHVFMQFDMQPDGSVKNLPAPCVDTGMGLERLAAVLQHVHSNYEIDLFQDLIKAAARETHAGDLDNPSLKVIADHIRAAAFLVSDGVIPGSEGRGYVLRRIVRRALRHGHKLGQAKPFFHKLVKDVVKEMGAAYPQLASVQAKVTETLKAEEERFAETLENGMKILEVALNREGATIDGETVFALYDTYGFPVDLTADVARERGKSLDMAGYEAAMDKQRTQARAASKFQAAANVAYEGAGTEFRGYESLAVEDATITALYRDGASVSSLSQGENGIVVLDRTPFYAESGGQVGDAGELVSASAAFKVETTQKIRADAFGHHGEVKKGKLSVGDKMVAGVDTDRRQRTMRNHSVTHIMHKALREVLGGHVQQKGSLVDADKTRFDFAHNKPMTDDEIRQVEQKVNTEILQNTPTQARVLPIEEAKKTGAMMLFGEKYGDEVRVLDIGSSRELCGGTHVARTGDIGLFKVLAESGVAAGVRRLEATTGATALALLNAQQQELREIAHKLNVPSMGGMVALAVNKLLDDKKLAEKDLARLKSKDASSQGQSLSSQATDVGDVKVLAASLEGADVKTLRETLDKLKTTLKSAAIVLGSSDGGKVSLIAGVTSDLTGKIKAGELVNFVAQQVGGKGGGRADMAQAGGTEPAKLAQALASVKGWVEQQAKS